MVKVVVVLNEKADIGAAINAAGHLCLGLPAVLQSTDLKLRTFRDSSGRAASLLTDYPLVILSARSERHLEEAHSAAIAEGIPTSAFFECMRVGEPEAQAALVASQPVAEQTYLAVAFFGSNDQLKPITRRFSLYRKPSSPPAVSS